MTKERFYIEINEENSTYDGKTLKVTVPADKQSAEGVDFYFNKEFSEGKNLAVTSVTVSPAPLLCYWQWLMSANGSPEYEAYAANSSVDVSKYLTFGIPGGFGFSGYTPDGSDIVLTFKISE